MKSLPTIKQFEGSVEGQLDYALRVLQREVPEYYLIWVALIETGVNPLIMPRIIRAMANIAFGTKYGKIQIFIQEGRVTHVKPEEWDQIELEILVDSKDNY